MTTEPQKEYIISGDLLDRVERALKYSGKNELAAEFGAIRNCFVSHSLANTNTKAMPSPAQPSGDVLRSDKMLDELERWVKKRTFKYVTAGKCQYADGGILEKIKELRRQQERS